MTARTTAAKDTDQKPAPVKKAAAKKTTAKTAAKRTDDTTGSRQPRTRRKDTEPKLSLVKGTETATIVDLRRPLTVRRRLFVGPMGPHEQAAIRAALDAARLHLPIPVRTWNGSQAQLADGTLLIHNPGPDRYFTAHIACPHGATHGWPITSLTDLKEARAVTRTCQRPHTEPTTDDNDIHQYDWDKAITHGIAPTAPPKPTAVQFLREGIRRAEATKADTQPLSLDDIAEGLTARAADQPKEHPQP